MLFNENKQLQWINELYQLGQSGSFQENPGQLYRDILRFILEGLDADTGSLTVLENERYVIKAGTGLPEACIGRPIPDQSAVIRWVLENRCALLLKGKIDQDPRFKNHGPRSDSRIPAASLCWPLISGQRSIGTICVNKLKEPSAYTEADLESGQLMANAIALSIDNMLLNIDRRKHIQELAGTNRQLQIIRRRYEESEKRLHDILNSLDSVVWSMEPGTFKLLYLNDAAEDISGRPVRDFLERPDLWLSIVDPKDKQNVENRLADLPTIGSRKLTYRILRPDGEQRWLYQSMRYVRDESGAPLRIDGITADITEHKKAEDLLKQRNTELQQALTRLQELQQQLMQSEKMSSIGQLAAGVAHEINNPIGYINSNLTSLKNYIEDLLELVEMYENIDAVCNDAERIDPLQAFKRQIDLPFLKEDVLDLLSESREGAERVKKIVQDLKDFSHVGGDDDWQWADLQACLDSTLNIVHNETKYKADIIKEYGGLPRVWCLPHQLNQVFMNLLVNAAHAIEDKGTITIRSGTEDGGRIWIEIADTGKGIDPKHLNKIFDPFFTTKPVGKGTGLGLSVSYSIIKKHHGEIRLDSRVGEGTKFRIVLPVEYNAPGK
ncbi:MAG: histidine kinase [Gammaproteobacteria bacterium HGW-Gammaproteobacteria-10]|nr:MAG: histidine kinase [Gammaproteobacteria bacterium HGW-Gammaproteobacteria-10]